METYRLYLESGPKHRKTMVHVLDLLGCSTNGPTTEAAIEATPAAIEAYRRLLKRVGESIDTEAPFQTVVAEHITEGVWIGNGTPYLIYTPELEPISKAEVEMLLNRFHQMRPELAEWAEGQSDKALDSKPSSGRSARAILLHVVTVPGAYLGPVAGGASGFSRINTDLERGLISIADALRKVDTMIAEMALHLTAEQRASVQHGTQVHTARKAFRRMLEHDWEHLMELSRRPEGPKL